MSSKPTPASYRCSACDADWPFHVDFEVCPLCRTPTWGAAVPAPPHRDPAKQAKIDAYIGWVRFQKAEMAAMSQAIAELPETAEPAPLPAEADEPPMKKFLDGFRGFPSTANPAAQALIDQYDDDEPPVVW